jgi:alpha-1,6-mannosyltransferase
VAVAAPPRFSHDLWSYAIVGRILAVHHASPYLHSARTFPHDALFRRVGSEWRTGTTPYGPLFVAHAASIAFVAGSHAMLYRLAFQSGAAIAIGAAMLACWCETKRTSALALIGLHPVVACSVVNGGHNDAFVGLGVLLAVIAVRHRRFRAGGWCLVAALLVKATAGLALLPLLAWSWKRGGRHAARALVSPCLLAVAGMAAIPGFVHSLRHANTTTISRTSIWNLPLRTLPHLLPDLIRPAPFTLVRVALLALLLVVVAATVWSRRSRDPAAGVVAALTGWVAFGAYVLPWYAIWALPTAALHAKSRLTALVAIQGALATAAFLIPRSVVSAGGVVTETVRVGVPLAVAALFVWALAGRTVRPDRYAKRMIEMPPAMRQ